MHDNRDLDELLNEALVSYVEKEPDPLLRARIMARTAKSAPRAKRMWVFGAAVAAAATLVFVLLPHPQARSPRPEPATVISATGAPHSPAPVRAVPLQTIHPHPALATHRTRRSERPTLIRNASFPSPRPLTAEETILLKFATEHPDQARQVLQPPAPGPVENAPLAIAPIHIAALSETQETQHWQEYAQEK